MTGNWGEQRERKDGGEQEELEKELEQTAPAHQKDVNVDLALLSSLSRV